LLGGGLSLGDIKAFAYGVLNWSEKKLLNASLDYFVHACLGWNHNQLYSMQTTNNLNKRLAFAIAEITHAKKEIKLEKYFELFEKKNDNLANEINEISDKFPTSLNNGKE
jgi:hypothetical protein